MSNETLQPNDEGVGCVLISFIAALILGAALLFGCASTGGKGTTANDSPPAIAARSLLSARQVLIAAATTADILCSQGIINQVDCDHAKQIYTQGEAAYVAASSAMLLVVQDNDTDAWQRYEALAPRLLALTMDIDSLVKSFPGGGR